MFSFHNNWEHIFCQKGDLALKKLVKWFGIFAVIGTAVGLAVAYFRKNNSDDSDQTGTDFTEDEDFDLDADLKPAEREYVSLKKDPEKTSEEDREKSNETEGSENPEEK